MIKKYFFGFFIVFMPLLSMADLTLISSVSQDEAESLLHPYFSHEAIWPFGDKDATLRARWKGEQIQLYPAAASQFSWSFNGKRIYSSVVTFDPINALRRQNQDVMHLLIFDEKISILDSIRITINAKRNLVEKIPYLNFRGIGGGGANSFLVALDYFDSAEYLKDPGGDFKIHPMVVNIVVENANGDIHLKQDDSCLGNPNQLGTIPKARKMLERCAATQKKN